MDGYWHHIGGPAMTLIPAWPPYLSTLFATNPDSGDIYQYYHLPPDYPPRWTRIGGPGSKFVTTQQPKQLFGLTPSKDAIYKWTGTGTDWIKIGGPAADITAFSNLFATNPDSGDIYLYNNSPHNWTRIGGPGSKFVAGQGGRLYGLTPSKDAIYQTTIYASAETGTDWIKIGGPAADVIAGGQTVFATNPDSGDIYQYYHLPPDYPHRWTRIGGPGSMFVAGGRRLCGLTPNKDAIFQWTGTGTDWIPIGGPAEFIAITGSGVDLFALSPNEKHVWRFHFN